MTGLTKKLDWNSKEKRLLIEDTNKKISISRQCEIIGLNRSTYYLEPKLESEENLILMALIDKEYLKHPFLGSRRLVAALKDYQYDVNRKRIQRLMRIMGIKCC